MEDRGERGREVKEGEGERREGGREGERESEGQRSNPSVILRQCRPTVSAEASGATRIVGMNRQESSLSGSTPHSWAAMRQ